MTLYVYMQRLSGNLDPLFAIADSKYKLRLFDEQLKRLLQQQPENPFQAFRELLDSFYLAWDDDSGSGTDAALQFAIPADGDYKIVVAGSRQPVGRKVMGQTFGSYRLVIGLTPPGCSQVAVFPPGRGLPKLRRFPAPGRAFRKSLEN